MFQATSERLIRAAGRFNWSADKLRIVAAVIEQGHHPRDVAYTEGLREKRVTNMVGEARAELHAQAVLECEMAAFQVDLRVETDPILKEEHAAALQFALNYEDEYPVCLAAVEAVGAY